MKKHNCKAVNNCKITYEEDRSSAELDLDVENLILDIIYCPYCGKRLIGDVICIKNLSVDNDMNFKKGHRYVVVDQDQYTVSVEFSDYNIYCCSYKSMEEYFKNVDN